MKTEEQIRTKLNNLEAEVGEFRIEYPNSAGITLRYALAQIDTLKWVLELKGGK